MKVLLGKSFVNGVFSMASCNNIPFSPWIFPVITDNLDDNLGWILEPFIDGIALCPILKVMSHHVLIITDWWFNRYSTHVFRWQTNIYTHISYTICVIFQWYSDVPMIFNDTPRCVPYLCTRLQHLEWVEAKCGCGYHGGKRQKNGSWDITDKSKLWLYRYYIYSFYIYQIFFK